MRIITEDNIDQLSSMSFGAQINNFEQLGLQTDVPTSISSGSTSLFFASWN